MAFMLSNERKRISGDTMATQEASHTIIDIESALTQMNSL